MAESLNHPNLNALGGKIRLGVNIDHVATIRNARGGLHPDPVQAAQLAGKAGADGITAHLREDRRHISDRDIHRLTHEIDLPINLEMAATYEMLGIALEARPNAICLVPEKRAELTTEGGLDLLAPNLNLRKLIEKPKAVAIRVTAFIDPDLAQVDAAKSLGVDAVELHTGKYCDSVGEDCQIELARLSEAARAAVNCGLSCHAGHGLDFETVKLVAAIPEVSELNIGHFLIGQAIFNGLENSVARMRALIDQAHS
tara:strand:- start:431 stop:1198 length:768 start_codon:yes stop_codon:yes gene_type:complete